jgi:hypothetical protein
MPKSETLRLYGGDVEMVFNPKGHLYLVNNRVVPGVTSATKGMMNANALCGWSVNLCRGVYKERIKPGVAYDEAYLAETYRLSWAHQRKSGTAALIGNLVHEWINKKCRGIPVEDPVNEQALAATKSFARWAKEVRFKPRFTERMVFSRKYGYAGTVDIFGEVEGIDGVTDIKIRNKIYTDMELQVTAYLQAIQEELHDFRHDGCTGRLILRIDRETGDIETRRLDPESFESDLTTFVHHLEGHRAGMIKEDQSRGGEGFRTYIPDPQALAMPMSTAYSSDRVG